MRSENKRWLLSAMKTSGSRRARIMNGRFADERNTKKYSNFENLPQRESIKSTTKFYNGKINYGLLVRFLRGQVGNDWDDVYSEIISRIPSKLLDYREMIFWFVADKVEYTDNGLWNKRSSTIIWTSGPYDFSQEKKEFFVNPITNKLERIPDIPKQSAKKR
jgi:hypothetical protein